MRPESRLRLWLALATVYVVWGSTYLAIRVLVETVPPLLGASLRFVSAGAIFALWLLAVRGTAALRIRAKQLAGAAFVGALLMFGGNGGVSVAEQEAPSGLAALIIAAVPLWVIVWRLLFRERVAAGTLGGVALGFLGVALLVVPGRPEGAPLWSVLLLVASSASWASGSFLSAKVPLPPDPVVAATVEMLLGGALLGVVGLAVGEASDFDVGAVSGRSIAAFVYLVVAGSLLAFTAYVWLLQNAPISTVATYAFVNPVVAVLLGWAILDETITGAMLAGAALIVATVAFVVRKESAGEAGEPH